jgi:hypothetical protein
MAKLGAKSGGHNVFFIVQVVADLHPAIYNQKCRAKVSAIKLVLIAEPKLTLTPKGGKPLTINHYPPLSASILRNRQNPQKIGCTFAS